MRAITIESPGRARGTARSAEVPDPVPGAGEVLIDIAAAGLNRADLLQRQGFYPPPPGAPPYPGLECSGRIVAPRRRTSPACGRRRGLRAAGRRRLRREGRRRRRSGAADSGRHHASPARRRCPRSPARSTPTSCTWPAWPRARRCSCTAARSGIGTFAIQLGRALGARVACTAGSQAKLDRCRELGAELAIPYPDQDFVDAIG